MLFNHLCLKPHVGPWQTNATSLLKPPVRWRLGISISLPIQLYIRPWLIPVRVETSRRHIFSCPSGAISVISKPKVCKNRYGCGACDVLWSHVDTSMESEGGPGSAWSSRWRWCLRHRMLYRRCTGLSHWIRAPTARLEAEDEW